MTLSRRSFIAALPLLGCAPAAPGLSALDAPLQHNPDLAALETLPNARLGVCILDTATGAITGHRLNERFALCSTFKMALAAAVLRAVDRGQFAADQIVPYTQADMVPHHPVTGPNLAKGGMALLQLAEAAQKTSDNVAANLLMRMLGGPDGLTAFFRDLGDQETRIDRYEPMMNFVPTGEVRDTTTPLAMARATQAIFTSKVLSEQSRALLTQWMIETDTGAKRIRAGLPKDWRAGDKTGTGLGEGINNFYNDIAIIWPPGRTAPLVVTAYYDAGAPFDEMRDEDQAVLAAVGRIASNWAQSGHLPPK